MSNWKGKFLWRYYDVTVINFHCNFKICIPAGNTNRLWCNCLFRKTGHHNYTCSWLNISSPLKSRQYSQCYCSTISSPSLFLLYLFWDAHICYEKICRLIPSPHLQTPGTFFRRPWLCFHKGFFIISQQNCKDKQLSNFSTKNTQDIFCDCDLWLR